MICAGAAIMEQKKPKAKSIVASIILSLVVVTIALIGRVFSIGDCIGYVILDFTLVVIVGFLVLILVEAIRSKKREGSETTKDRATAILFYAAFSAMALSLYPTLTGEIFNRWDFRFFAVGIAILSLFIAMYKPKG